VTFFRIAGGSNLSALEKFEGWSVNANLPGNDALPDATPFHDGIPNLLKYAFNMNGSGPDVSRLAAGTGTSGLPCVSLAGSGPAALLRIEYLRRKDSGLIYTPQRSTSLASFDPMTGTTTVTGIDDHWERVVIEEPVDPAVTPHCFGRVAVTFPP
jgi:hypothetical protein